jgi:hypothetical protein
MSKAGHRRRLRRRCRRALKDSVYVTKISGRKIGRIGYGTGLGRRHTRKRETAE